MSGGGRVDSHGAVGISQPRASAVGSSPRLLGPGGAGGVVAEEEKAEDPHRVGDLDDAMVVSVRGCWR